MKRFIVLDPDQIAELKLLLKKEDRVKIQRRLHFIQMKHEGKKNTEIMPILQVSMGTCRDWTGIFLNEGFSGLCSLQYDGRRPGKLEENKIRIKEHIDAHLIPTLTVLKDWILKELSISVQTSWLGEWCKKNSIILTKK